MQRKYIEGADGQMYEEIRLASGECEYNPVSLDAVRVSDDAVAKEYLAGQKGHEAYFRKLEMASKNDPALVKQDFRRQKALERRLEMMAVDMVMPPQAPNIEFITDERFLDLTSQYAKAVAEGHPKECEFQPVTAYQHKLMTKSGKMIRPLYRGEVGILGEKSILVLEPGYGVGSSEQVVGEILAGGGYDESGNRNGDSGRECERDIHTSDGPESVERVVSGEESGDVFT